jgi:hypothetical protein
MGRRIVVSVPTAHRAYSDFRKGITGGAAFVAGYVFEVVTRLLAIWIVCGLVWLTLYRRSRPS